MCKDSVTVLRSDAGSGVFLRLVQKQNAVNRIRVWFVKESSLKVCQVYPAGGAKLHFEENSTDEQLA